MTVGNIIYLAVLTGRTAILPPFAPSHVGADAPLVPFSEIFDIERLSRALRAPLLEWHEVKDIESDALEPLGCWSVWGTVAPAEGPRKSVLTPVQKLGAWHRVPAPAPATGLTKRRHLVHGRARVDTARERQPHDVLEARQARVPRVPEPEPGHATAAVARAAGRARAGRAAALLRLSVLRVHRRGARASASVVRAGGLTQRQPYEYEHDYSPVWREIVTNMHWTRRMHSLADDVLRQVLAVPDGQPIPPVRASPIGRCARSRRPQYISLHVRHGDFGEWCGA
jgi:hypothetical protein